MKRLVLALMMVLAMVAVAFGQANPPPGGWGTDMTNWQTASDPYDTGELVYKTGVGYVTVPGGAPVVWEDIWVKLWIEMEIRYTLSATHLQVHRISDYSDIGWLINGTWSGNHTTWFFWDAQGGAKDLFHLEFINGVAGTGVGTDIPVTWQYRIDGGTWYPFYVMGWGFDYGFQLPVCDHTFDIYMTADVVYHQEDGYYYLDPLAVCAPLL